VAVIESINLSQKVLQAKSQRVAGVMQASRVYPGEWTWRAAAAWHQLHLRQRGQRALTLQLK
jgi:hypothetical protein